MELLRHVTSDSASRREYGPIYNGVALDDPRMTRVYEHCVAQRPAAHHAHGHDVRRNAPVDLGRAIHVEPVALRYPELKIVLAHMGHPWYEDTIAVVRKQPNVYAEISAIYYRPWQFWNVMIARRNI